MAVLSRVPKNYIAWNEEPNRVPPWALAQATVPSIAVTAPDGSSTAAILHEDATGAAQHYISQPFLGGVNRVLCISAFVLQKARNWFMLGSSNPNAQAWFNVGTGVVGALAGGLTIGIVARPSSWYLVYFTILNNANTATTAYFQVAPSDGNVVFDGLNQDSFYIWRPSVCNGYVPEDLSIKTTEVPRT